MVIAIELSVSVKRLRKETCGRGRSMTRYACHFAYIGRRSMKTDTDARTSICSKCKSVIMSTVFGVEINEQFLREMEALIAAHG